MPSPDRIHHDPVTRADTCPEHGEYQATVHFLDGRELFASGCPACTERRIQQAEAAERRRVEREAAVRAGDLWRRAEVPERFAGCTFETYDVPANSEGQRRALARCRWFVDTWPERRKAGSGLLMLGNTGNGKTHLGAAIIRAVTKQGASARYTTVGDMLRAVRATYGKDSELREGDALERFVWPDLLVLDEVGVERDSEHVKSTLFHVINKRYERLRPTVVISNLTVEAFRDAVGDRVVDRLKDGGGKFIPFDWSSHRK